MVIAAVITGKIISSLTFTGEVKSLFSQAGDLSGKTFSYNQVKDLPEPVQCYFKHVMKEGQTYISYARLTHNGKFKTGPAKDRVNIESEQLYSIIVNREWSIVNQCRFIKREGSNFSHVGTATSDASCSAPADKLA